MATTTKDKATRALDAHAKTIDALHKKLAAMPGVKKTKLQKAASAYKSAHKAFHDDALDCMN